MSQQVASVVEGIALERERQLCCSPVAADFPQPVSERGQPGGFLGEETLAVQHKEVSQCQTTHVSRRQPPS